MKKNYLIRKIMALILVIFMIFGTGQYSAVRADESGDVIPTDENGKVIAEAEEGDPVEYKEGDDFTIQSFQEDMTDADTESVSENRTEENTEGAEESIEETISEKDEESTEETISEKDEESTEETISEKVVKSSKSTMPEKGTESTTEAASEKGMESTPKADPEKEKESSSGSDECLYRLLVGTENKAIFRESDLIISEYNNIYLLGFFTEKERAEGLVYYKDKADIAEYDDEIMTVARKTSYKETGYEDDGNPSDDALTILNEILNEEENNNDQNANALTIAVIDTGASESISEGISVIGDDPRDDNGHGTGIIKAIMNINPKARILSIKAFDNKGKAKPSDIYAAIMYAVSRKVSIINLSGSSIISEDSDVIREAVKTASEERIIFVGAAGNNGREVKYFIPGDIDEAYIAGACNEKGIKIPVSNYGEKVDYYVKADSTSVAAAILTGHISLDLNKKPESYDDIYLPKDIKLSENDMTNPGTEEVVVSYSPYSDVSTLSNKDRGSAWDKYFFNTSSVNDNPLIHLENNLDIYNANNGYGNQVPQNSKYLQTSYYYGAPEDENFSRVHPGYFERDGRGGLNCTAFPVWVLRNMGVGADTISSTIGYGNLGSIYSLFRWTNWIRDRVNDGQMIMYNYDSVETLLKDGRVKKGDLIIFEPTVSGTYDSDGQRIDHHIGFYWGDSSKENLFWHSTNAEWYEKYGEDLYKGAADHDGNKITGLQAKTRLSRVWVLPGSAFEYYMYFEKSCEGNSSMDGVEYTVTNTRTGKTLCTAVLNAEGHLKDIKNVTDDDHFRIERKVIDNKAYLKVTERLDDSRIQKWDITLNISVEESYVPENLHLVRNFGKAEFRIKNDISNVQKLSKNESSIFYNMRGKGLIEIYKVDESGNPLAGAVFRVKQGDKIIADVTTVSDSMKQGYYLLEGLDPGKYTVQEIQAPSGYIKDDTVYEVNISTDRTFSYNGIYYGYIYDREAYKEYNADIKKMTSWSDADFFNHFLNSGMNEYRVGSYNMSGYAYRQNYSDLDKAYGDDYPKYYYHYINAGVNEMRMGMPKTYYAGLETGRVHHDNSVSVIVKAGNKKREECYVTLEKTALNTSCTKGNPNYDLAGTTYGLYISAEDAKNNTNVLHVFSVRSDGSSDIWSIPAKYMNIDKESGEYKATTFYVKELNAGKGYRLSPRTVTVKVMKDNTKNNPAVIKVEDSPELNNVQIVINKCDVDGTNVEEGTGSLEGAEFLIRYYPVDTDVYYTEKELSKLKAAASWRIITKYDKGSKKYTAVLGKQWLTGSGNSSFYYEDGNKEPVIPYGYLVIKEIKAPKGYESAGVHFKYSNKMYDKDEVIVARIIRTGSITVEGKAVTGEITAEDKPIRGDIVLSKKSLEGKAMGDVEFEITSLTTGESYKVKTDENGVIDSRKSGLWFGKKKDGSFTDKKEGLGALPIGEYTVKELRTKANEGKIIEVPFSIAVTESKVYRVKDNSIRYEDITNVDVPSIGTIATVSGSDLRFLPQNQAVTVTDRIKYKGLRNDSIYTLVGKVAVVDDEGNTSIYKKDGEEYIVIKQFKTPKEYERSRYEISGEETMSFDIDTKELSGSRIVVFEKMYLGEEIPEKDEDALQYEDNPGIFPLIHEDVDCEEQTLYIPSIKTTAFFADSEGNVKEAEIDEAEYVSGKMIMIKDVVSYNGLIPGDYEIRGVIMDKETGKLYEDNGSKITAAKKFHVTSQNGETEVLFKIPIPEIKEDTELNLVVFEELYKVGGNKVLLAEHKQIDDTDQTVKLVIKKQPDIPGKPDDLIQEEKPGMYDEPVKPGEKPKPEKPIIPTEPVIPENPDSPVPSNPPTTYVVPPDNSQTPNKPPVPRTGDEIPLVWIISLAVLSVGGIIVIKRKDKDNKMK